MKDKHPYRKVCPRIWNDSRFLALDPDHKLIWLFILTHPQLTPMGCMRATINGLADELKLLPERFREGFAKLLREGLIEFDEAGFLVVKNFLEYNPPANQNVCASWRKLFEFFPECPLLTDYDQRVYEFVNRLGNGFGNGYRNGFGNGYRNGIGNHKGNQKADNRKQKKNIPDPANADSGTEQGEQKPKPDPLEVYPKIARAYPAIRDAIQDAHHKARLPEVGSDREHEDRQTLDRLVRLDGFTEAEVLDTLRWVLKESTREPSGFWWRDQCQSITNLRDTKTGDTMSKFAKMHEAMGRAKTTTDSDLTPAEQEEARRYAAQLTRAS